MKKLEKDGIIHKKEWGKPYRLKENFVGEIYRLRSNKNEFSRDEQAKQERKDNRNLYSYQLALEGRVFYYVNKVGFDPDIALIKARDKTKEPVLGNIRNREYRISTHQQRALRSAIRKHNDLQDQRSSTEEEMKERFEHE